MALEDNNFERIAELILLHKAGKSNLSDQNELDNWLQKDQRNQLLFDELCSTDHLLAQASLMNSFEPESKLIAFHHKRNKKSVLKLWSRIAAAAAVVLIAGAGYLFLNTENSDPASHPEKYTAINPAKQGATLVLGNGQKISLKDAANGKITTESGVSITKTADGKLVYEIKNPGGTSSDKPNTIYTGKGEIYQLSLPDGSLVWLNASSSLTYNASLNQQGKRVVKLVGEAYFEVFKDKQHPFVVQTDHQDVEVLGTHFNINSYQDEATVNTTLLEGSVRINNKLVLKPNEQANLYKNGNILVSRANENAVAWKDGNFVFEKENIESIMRKLARWYNVEIVYHGERSTELYSGITNRSANISQVLSMLEKTGTVNFKIDGNKIIISKTN